jgi:hypothetical protein
MALSGRGPNGIYFACLKKPQGLVALGVFFYFVNCSRRTKSEN